jgi:hypothetical protein
LCVSGMISCPTASCQGEREPVIFRIARDCEADHTAAAVDDGRRLIIVCLYAFVFRPIHTIHQAAARANTS